LTLRHSRSTKTLSRQAPLPSMLMAMAFLTSTPVNAVPVNWLPWSVLKMSGLPWRARASSRISTQNAASIVIESRHDSTRRLNQSSTTAK
jgi:hypothetical protein